MKRQLVTTILFFSAHFLIAQNALHPLPHANFQQTVSDSEVVSQINQIVGFLDDPNGHDGCAIGDPSSYYGMRVLAHVELYTYYLRIGDAGNQVEQLQYLKSNLQSLLCQQCVGAPADGLFCGAANGGFPSTVNNDDESNPLSTSIGLQALLKARNLYELIGQAQMPITCAEFEYRIEKAKDALFNYPEFNNQYFNLTAFSFITAGLYHERYQDQESIQFLTEKAEQLLLNEYPLRPNAVPNPIPSATWNYANVWNYTWSEGYQSDGSWKGFGRDVPSTSNMPRTYGPCERWHDSEFDYHCLITQGLAILYGELGPGILKDTTKDRLIGSLNHVIDYNGESSYLELPFNSDIIANGYAQTRLTPGGRISRYHRETDSVCKLNPLATNYTSTLQRKEIGVTYLRSLIFSKLALSQFPANIPTLDSLISGVTAGILATNGSTPGFSFQQLYDLSLYLNKDHLTPLIATGQTPLNSFKNKLIVALESDPVKSFQGDTPNGILNSEYTFYNGNQKVQHSIAGDFNGDGLDELILSFKEGRAIYRYEEDCKGLLVVKERFYDRFVFDETGNLVENNGILTQELEVGDFDGDGKDELIVAFADGRIERYYEGELGGLVADNTPLYTLNNLALAMAVGNFDEAGADELVVFTADDLMHRYFFNSGLAPLPFVAKDKAEDIEALNFKYDDTDELAVASGEYIYLYHDLASGLNPLGPPLVFNGTTPILTKGNFNHDEYDELIVAHDDLNITRCTLDPILYQLTAEPPFYTGNQLAREMVALDFDRDGQDELAIAFSGGWIYRCSEVSGTILLNGGIYHGSANSTRKMTVLNKFRRSYCETGICGSSSSSSSKSPGYQVEIQEEADLARDQSPVTIYPNPVANILRGKGINGNTPFSLYNGQGQLIRTGQWGSSRSIDLSYLPSGLYFLVTKQKVFKVLKSDHN